MAVGVTIGHPCTECQATMEACDLHIKEHGRGCCGACFIRDTHGLLDKFKIHDVAEQAQDIENLHRLMAQMVLARGEHARAIYALRNDVSNLTEQIALLRGDQERADEGEKRRLLMEVMTEVRTAVLALPERVKELEDVVAAIEAVLKLRRRPPEVRDTPPVRTPVRALPPPKPPAKTEVALEDNEEPKRRWSLRRNRDDEEDYYG